MAHELVFDSVTKRAKQNGCADVAVFSGLNLTVPEGEHLAVIGGSGVGKTTLLKLANRLEDPDSGKILFGGQTLNSLDVTRHRRNVSLVLQKPCLFFRKVLENVTYADTLINEEPDISEAGRLLELVGVDPELFERDGNSLSVGQQQRVCLARALYCRPKILMLDETTASLDPMLAIKVLNQLFEISRKTSMTILHVTHDMAKIKLADRVVLLDGGGIAEEGKPKELLKSPSTDAGRNFLGL